MHFRETGLEYVDYIHVTQEETGGGLLWTR